MATNIKSNYLGGIYIQSGDGIPIHLSPLGSLYIDLNIPPSGYLSNGDGTWNSLGTISSGTSGFDVYVTGGTYNAGTAVFTNNTGGTFSVTGFSTSNATEFTGGTVTGSTQFTGGLTADTMSATTYYNLPVDVFVTGFSYSANQFTISDSTGGTLSVIANDFTAATITSLSSSTLNVSTQSNLSGVISTSFSGSTSRIVEASSGGTLSSTRELIDSFLTGGTAATLLGTALNWSPSKVYTGTTITGTYQGQQYYNSDYYFVCVDDNDWIRLARA